MRYLCAIVLLSAMSLAQAPPTIMITNACCASLSQVNFTVQGASGVVSLPYGVSSTTITATAGTSVLHASAGSDLNFTSDQFTLLQDKAYTTALYGNLSSPPKLVGPIENLTQGDAKKIRMRLGLLSTYVQQAPPQHSQVRLRVFCPSFGSTPVFDLVGSDGAFSDYAQNAAKVFHDNCQLQLVKGAGSTATPILQQSYPLGTANNYTVLAIGSNDANLMLLLFTDNK